MAETRFLGRPAIGALLPFPFFGGGFPYENRLQKKVGSLILTSLLEDLEMESVGCHVIRGFATKAIGNNP